MKYYVLRIYSFLCVCMCVYVPMYFVYVPPTSPTLTISLPTVPVLVSIAWCFGSHMCNCALIDSQEKNSFFFILLLFFF